MSKTMQLSTATIFSDFNKRMRKEEGFKLSQLILQPIKYKHIKELHTIKPEDHMTYLMSQITGLAESDVEEMMADDAAELIKLIYKSLDKHIELSKLLLGTGVDQQALNNFTQVKAKNSL